MVAVVGNQKTAIPEFKRRKHRQKMRSDLFVESLKKAQHKNPFQKSLHSYFIAVFHIIISSPLFFVTLFFHHQHEKENQPSRYSNKSQFSQKIYENTNRQAVC